MCAFSISPGVRQHLVKKQGKVTLGMTVIANASTVCQALNALHILIHLIQQSNDVGNPILYFSDEGTEAEMGQTAPDCIAKKW